MEVPEVRYAKSGAINIAYQRFGTGPDVVAIPPLVTNVEIMWEHEVFRRFLEFRARHTRVLQFDKRGIGMSDRVVHAPTLEERIGDIVAVMDREQVARASLVGVSEGGLMAQHFAATYPERVDRLVLVSSAPGLAAVGELPAFSRGEALPTMEDTLARFGRLVESWGRAPEVMAEWFVPSQMESASFLRWLARFQRQSASPADLQRQVENVAGLSMPRERLARIQAPTLVIQVLGDRVVPRAAGRYLAATIPGATLLEVEGEDHFCFTMANWSETAHRLIAFLTGAAVRAGAPPAQRAAALVAPAGAAGIRARLRRDGAVWMLSYRGETFAVPHVRGLLDLRCLLQQPGVPIHVRDLDSLGAASSRSEALRGDAAEGGCDGGDAGECLDARARSAYRARIGELRADIDDAERSHDSGRAGRVRAELEMVERELRGAVGLGGRPRRAASRHERLRVAVSKRLRTAIARISAACPALGEHLRRTIRTGTTCVYAPAAAERLEWSD